MAAAAALKRQFEQAASVEAAIDEAKQNRGREIGTIQHYDKGKGFGFLHDADHEKLFVHHSQIVSPGFRQLEEGQKVSFTRGENRGKPWAEDVRDPDGSPIVSQKEETESVVMKKRKKELKEQWRNFFDIPQYALKGYGEALPHRNEDGFVVGEAVQQIGKVFVMMHGCCAEKGARENEAVRFLKERFGKYIAKSFEEKNEVAWSLQNTFELLETELMERCKMKSLTDGAETTAILFAHALNSAGQPCVQMHVGNTGASVVLLCTADGDAVRVTEPHSTKKVRGKLSDCGFEVGSDGSVQVAFAEVGQTRPNQKFALPATRLLGARPFKTSRKTDWPISATPDIKTPREWRCVAGEELFLVVVSDEVLSVLSDQDVINAALDAWGSGAEGLDGWEAASKAVVRTALARGPASETLACLAVQCWWQEKPLQRLLARRADRKKSGVDEKPQGKAAEGDGFDMFG